MAIAVFINWWVKIDGGGAPGSITLELTTAPNTPLGSQDTPDALLYDYNKLVIQTSEAADVQPKYNNDGLWMPVNNARQIFVQVGITGIGEAGGVVVAYEEHNLDDITNIVW
jgi:hypothetical protein